MSIEEKRRILETLEKDVEFRYALMGLLGYKELLDRFSRLEEGQKKLWENQNKLWEEVRGLREETRKLWENISRLWEEVRALREGQNKLWENVSRLWEEVRGLREETRKLWEGQNKLWEEVRALREGQNKLWNAYIRLDRYVRSGFSDLRRILGSTFGSFAAAFIEVMLEDMGYTGVRVDRKILVVDNEVLEIDLFSEKPLVVGELTMYLGSMEEARKEVEKLLKRVKAVEKLYGMKPILVILCVAKVVPELLGTLRNLTKDLGIRLITKEDIEEEVGSI